MSSKKSFPDIANPLIRIILGKLGETYDIERGFTPFTASIKQKQELLQFFNFQCCYCGVTLTTKTISQDHLIPQNRNAVGLHAWGNVAPCCSDCNSKKHKKSWESYLLEVCLGDTNLFNDRKQKLIEFIKHYRYEHIVTDELQQWVDKTYKDAKLVATGFIDSKMGEYINNFTYTNKC